MPRLLFPNVLVHTHSHLHIPLYIRAWSVLRLLWLLLVYTRSQPYFPTTTTHPYSVGVKSNNTSVSGSQSTSMDTNDRDSITWDAQLRAAFVEEDPMNPEFNVLRDSFNGMMEELKSTLPNDITDSSGFSELLTTAIKTFGKDLKSTDPCLLSYIGDINREIGLFATSQSLASSNAIHVNDNATGRLFSLSELDQYAQSRLTDNVEPRAIIRMTRETMEDWPDILNRLLDSLQRGILAWVEALMDKHLGQFEQWAGYRKLHYIAWDVIDSEMERLRDTCNRCLDAEMNGPFIITSRTVGVEITNYESTILHMRRLARLDLIVQSERERQGPAARTPEELERREYVQNLLDNDPYEVAVKGISFIVTHHASSRKRFRDVVAMQVCNSTGTRLQNNLSRRLTDHLYAPDEQV